MPPHRPGAHRVLVGCSGWNYAHWRRGVFYPEGCPAERWLGYYAERFGTVELNTTFYRLPRAAAAARWAEETPPGFVFAAKVSRFVTHVKRLLEVERHLPLLLGRLEPLAAAGKLGPLLWQLPPTFRRDDERLAAALGAAPRSLRHAVEFRHPSWFQPDVMALLRERGVALVIADRPEIRSFQTHELTAGFTYLRFHHGSRGARGNYSEGELAEWAARIRGFAEAGDVYAYFNNDWEGFAPRNASRLRALVER
ncbi:MAG TPA: DUF72 domain-containing protein [Gaiellaceae bacterium]|nr:DUF72 domain-containing protein [Gaiellaceae bacterium]